MLELHVAEPLAYRRAKLAADGRSASAERAGGVAARRVTRTRTGAAAAIRPAVSISLNEPGINAKKQIEELGAAAGNTTPPDTTGTIGPANYLEIVNREVAAYDRSNLKLHAGSPLGLATFTGGTVPCDPQIKFDPQTSRWFYVAIRCDGTKTANEIYFGWSKTSDPTNLAGSSEANGWCRFGLNEGKWLFDYPKLGLDANHVIVGFNVFNRETGSQSAITADIAATAKPASGALTSCPATANFTLFPPAEGTPLMTSIGNKAFTPEPATVADSSPTGYVVAADRNNAEGGNHLMLWEVAGTAEAPELKALGDVEVTAFKVPPGASQPEGSTDRIDTLDARLTQAVAAADPNAGAREAVWTQHTIESATAGSVVRWYEVVPSTLSVRQQGTIEDAAGFAFNGAIAPTRSGAAVVDYNAGGSGQRVAIKAQSRGALAPLGTMGAAVTLQESSAIDSDFSCPSQPRGRELGTTSCRWGDYAGASVDPVNPTAVWGSNQVDGPTGALVEGNHQVQWATQNFGLETPTESRGLFINAIKVGAIHVGTIVFGPMKLVSPQLETEIECVSLGFGGVWNEGSPSVARGQILGWGASGDITPTGTLPSRQCKFKKGGAESEAWATAEPPLVQTGTQGKHGEPLTVPWNVEVRCGEREEELTTIGRIGVPNGTAPAVGCQAQTPEGEEVSSEEAEHRNCYAEAAPAGCIKLDIVQPALGLETVFQGSLRPTWVNGFGSGLNASRLKFEGVASGKLRQQGVPATEGVATGQVKMSGFNNELIQAK